MVLPHDKASVTDEADDLDDAVLGELVDAFDDEGADDAVAELDDVELDEPPALADDDELALDTGGALDEVPVEPEQEWTDGDAALGPGDLEDHADLEQLAPLEHEEQPDGPDEPLPNLDLPRIDAADDDESLVLDTGAELPRALGFGDEPRPPPGERTWVEHSPSIEVEACGVLALAEGTGIAASTDLLWFARGEVSPLRLEAGATRIHSAVLVGTERDAALCSTSSGRLLRRGRSTPAPEELRSPRLPGESNPVREPLDLYQSSKLHSEFVVARSASGQLLFSDDAGATYQRADPRNVRALARAGTPLVALTDDAVLLSSSDGGRSYSEVPLSGIGREIALGPAPLVAAGGNGVVLGSPELGVAVSSDRGHSFVRVPGTRKVTALTVSADRGTERAFVALEDDGLDQSLIVEIELASARARSVVAIQGLAEDDADRVRVAALAWDSEHARLWVVGAFGVKVFLETSH